MVWTIKMPDGKDVNDCTKEEFDKYMDAQKELARKSAKNTSAMANQKKVLLDFKEKSEFAYGIYRLFEIYYERLTQQEKNLYRNVELPLSKVLYDMEIIGVNIDEDALKSFSTRYNTEIKELKSEIYELAGEEIAAKLKTCELNAFKVFICNLLLVLLITCLNRHRC